MIDQYHLCGVNGIWDEAVDKELSFMVSLYFKQFIRIMLHYTGINKTGDRFEFILIILKIETDWYKLD